ncbi:hypothetical protein I5907_05605 [Panacibacter sp. DH6]|uniref:Uncharacterized protein n=1 Tax=Panacibacter microcysteis TaxID=2793269 RepID=A0A931E7I5_9BACT|nr:hypothetical protein [Panacibacter microcysteis]MBG9375699.1 hypothetical protein [Panacibacter microcysteis]
MIRPFIPAFLKRFDDKFLKNNPELWSTRAHLVIYYCIVINIVLALTCYIIPAHALADTTAITWAGFLSIISLLGIIIWIIYLLRFNVFKRFGQISPMRTTIVYLLYFISTAAICSFAYIPALVETIKANRDYSKSKVITDINKMNVYINQLEYSYYNKPWNVDTVVVMDTLPENLKRQYIDVETVDTYEEDYADTTVAFIHGYYKIIDTVELRSKVATADSMVKINDTLYAFFECPDYVFVGESYWRRSSSHKTMSSKEIYDSVLAHYVAPNKKLVKNSLDKLLNKYYLKENEPKYATSYDPQKPKETIDARYRLTTINNGINNYNSKAYRWTGFLGLALLRIIFYTSLIFSIILFVFRHSSIKTFFITLLCLVVLFIISGIFIGLFHSSQAAVYGWYLFYFIIFSVLSILAFTNKKRNIITGIAINSVTLMLAFLPLVVIALTEAIQRNYYYEHMETKTYDPASLDMLFKIAEVAGPVIFILSIFIFMHSLYRKWYSLPQD